MRGRERECNVSPLFLKTYVCVLTFSYHFFSRSPTITEVFHKYLHGFLWLPTLDRAIVYYQYSKKGNVSFG
jgi:hypothetical protein